LPEAAKRLRTFCQFEDIPDFIYVGDAVMYSNILPLSEKMKWLMRVPETLSEAKDYSYGEVEQRWVMIFSEQASKKEIKTLEKNILKEESLQKEWNALSNVFFLVRKMQRRRPSNSDRRGVLYFEHE
jgi:transposase